MKDLNPSQALETQLATEAKEEPLTSFGDAG